MKDDSESSSVSDQRQHPKLTGYLPKLRAFVHLFVEEDDQADRLIENVLLDFLDGSGDRHSDRDIETALFSEVCQRLRGNEHEGNPGELSGASSLKHPQTDALISFRILPIRDQLAFVLVNIVGYSLTEAATILGSDASSVSQFIDTVNR